MKQGRFGLVLLLLSFFSFLGCGLQTDAPTNKQTHRLMDELRAQTALKSKLQQELDERKGDVAKLQEEADAARSDALALLAENDQLVSELRELKKERDAQATALSQLRKGMKHLLDQAEASLGTPKDATAAR